MELVMAVDAPQPSPAERLIAEYGHEWDIWRVLEAGGKHGPWKARKWNDPGAELTADTIQDLADALQAAQQPDPGTSPDS
ncbi:hypothetical protein [Thermomonospora cellulosilytica]|uniref:Uncharacterized protein n=1 Tax=Thermomonospora cellulosilytica TaxID=1411118 RepID=A0A7W3RAJ1_9ACTN|nr:hypothetical protein [Thermomonospora cellulosilytica]MBA9005927.1 hypothetical protein [Thermomonospora cellulosilytica]